MPAVYGITPGVTQTTNGSANTETDALFIKPGANWPVMLQQALVRGAGAALTTLTSLGFRIKKLATASTAGTSLTPAPRSGRFTTAQATSAYTPTAGATPTLQGGFSCSATGPGGWTAPNGDSTVALGAADAGSIDIYSVSGGTSLAFELHDVEVIEG
jgi:hypothetical protein